MSGRTSIVVAHRLTTVQQCTRLAVLDDGKIVEDGPYEELIANEGGFFQNLAKGMRKKEEKQAKAKTDNSTAQ